MTELVVKDLTIKFSTSTPLLPYSQEVVMLY